MRPAMALSMLDLPQPEGPRMSRELPACRLMLRLRQRCWEWVGVKRSRERRVKPAWRRWVRTICREDAALSVKAAQQPSRHHILQRFQEALVHSHKQ